MTNILSVLAHEVDAESCGLKSILIVTRTYVFKFVNRVTCMVL